ncbi:MAG: glycosyltransferase family 4 protein [Myxococcota bacterium]|jgi:glycosyltransferase involved in cell wall biosynthesis|nr:glycosyltransferase family 4 protein [Myxococcota bacterium]
MRVAYLVNRYPAVSHTFIRREIEGLEAEGLEVERVTVRRVPDTEVPDPVDRAEQRRTHVLLADGWRGIAAATERVARRHPMGFAKAVELARRMGTRSIQGPWKTGAYLAEACRLFEICESRGVDHVHAHFGTNPAAVAAMCRTLGGPTFSFTVHGPEEFDRPELLHLREKIAAASFVVGVSSFGRSQLYRWTDVREWSKVGVVRCGVDGGFLTRELTPVPDAPRLVCVGRICEQKGQLLLVQAAAELVREGRAFELVLVGDGEMRGDVEHAAASLGVTPHLRITGWASGERVREELLGARAMVLPSFAEGLPVVLMEALALGRPVLTTYIAGIPELVTPREHGWLFPAGSVTALADAMRECLQASPAELSEMGRRGRARVAELHDSRKNAAELARLFASVAR